MCWLGRACAHIGVAPPGAIQLNIVFVIFRVCHGGALERDQGNLPQFASRDGGIRGHHPAPKPSTLQNVCQRRSEMVTRDELVRLAGHVHVQLAYARDIAS